jgi:S1-C subfamily serine protease
VGVGGPALGKAVASGPGFLLTRTGLIATNWYVVADARNIEVAFPESKDAGRAEVMIKDAVNGHCYLNHISRLLP